MEAAPDAVNFVNVPVGETYTQTVRITNISQGTFQIKRIETSSADFRVTGILLPVGCGARNQWLTANQAEINFEDADIGSSTKKEVLLTNSGSRELRISGISVSFQTPGSRSRELESRTKYQRGSEVRAEKGGAASGQPEGLERRRWIVVGNSANRHGSGIVAEHGEAELGGESGQRGRLCCLSLGGAKWAVHARIFASRSVYVDTGLAAGHTYYYVVAAVDADQVETEYSVQISATVPGA
jgi:hypothetical protein